MNRRIAAAMGMISTLCLIASAQAQEGLPSMEEAMAISQKTGRPILAMAGRKT